MSVEPLFESIDINNMIVSNRIVMPPMTTRFADDDGYATDQTLAYYRERARGGTGLIIFESSYPWLELVDPQPNRHRINDDSCLEGLSRVTDAVHEEDSNIAIQMNTHKASAHVGTPLAPSDLTTPDGQEVRAITREEIDSLISNYAEGAERAVEAGFDGIEIHAASGYLLQQFLSPRTNDRDDEYGGSFEARTRLARELLSVVRDEVGEDFPVWFRVSGHEYLEDGINEPEAARIAQRLEGAGADAFHVTAGHDWNKRHIVLTGYEKRGIYADHAANIRDHVDVPVVAAGRINRPETAAEIVDSGKADLAAMGRAHIADPHLARKAKAGDLDRVRTCVGGMEGCRDMVEVRDVTCTVNPLAGYESSVEYESVDDPKDIVVIGGGPAGMETARIAAKRGHNVALYDDNEQLGGQLRYASNAPAKREYAELLRFFRAELDAYDVDVHLERRVEAEDIDERSPDAVVIAIGSEPVIPNIQGLSEAAADGFVLLDEEALTEPDLPGPVVIIGGTEIGCDIAETLAENGVECAIVAEGEILPLRSSDDDAAGLGTRPVIRRRLQENPLIELVTHTTTQEIRSGESVVVHVDGDQRLVEGNRVVLATGRHEANGLTEQIDEGIEATVIGDASGSNDLYTAIHEGEETGRKL